MRKKKPIVVVVTLLLLLLLLLLVLLLLLLIGMPVLPHSRHVPSGLHMKKREAQDQTEEMIDGREKWRPTEHEGVREEREERIATDHYTKKSTGNNCTLKNSTRETSRERMTTTNNSREGGSSTAASATATTTKSTATTLTAATRRRATHVPLSITMSSRCENRTTVLTKRIAMGAMLDPGNGMDFGEWGPYQQCPPGTYAHAFQIRVEEPLGLLGDDTALNGIRLICQSPTTGLVTASITSSVQCWGTWQNVQSCGAGEFLVGMALRVEEYQGMADDTAATDLLMTCEGGEKLEGGGVCWGTLSVLHTCPPGFAICGLKTRVESNAGLLGDNTALNNVIMYCCSMAP